MALDQPDSRALQSEPRALARAYVESVARQMGNRLRGALLFGPVARGEGRVGSDIELLMVASGPAPWRGVQVEPAPAEIQTLWGTPDEALRLATSNFDLAADGVVLLDLDGDLGRALEAARSRLRSLGARREWIGANQLWRLRGEAL